ncbi:NifU family protein [Halobacterium sp. NMX12-1]|uniref:NifU family protein n=1 Tax=Halobacterium sp. NMX12-1 TaxID=3166650 RepID=A0AAU8CEY7_9EURY
MSETAGAGSFHERVETWLTAQMPIIRSHGGTSAVRKADPADGEVVVELGGACSGCGISPRTAQRIKMDLAAEFDEVEDVVVRFTDGDGGGWGGDQPESYMGVDRNEGGRGGRGEGSPDSDSHF